MKSLRSFPGTADEALNPRTYVQYASQIWERIRRPLHDAYRPERHYMRGPGPKYRAKYLQNQVADKMRT